MTDGYTYFGKKSFYLPKVGTVWENRVFPRDIMLSAFMLEDYELMEEIAKFCVITQGRKNNSFTGEEPGKIIHEIDPATKKAPILRNLETRYNASDTNLLFMIMLEKLGRYHPYYLPAFLPAAKKSARYIERHTKNGMFFEDPKLCGANKFALRVTYWKDSELPVIKEPRYPVSYFLLQAQFVACVRSSQYVFNKLGIADKLNVTVKEALAGLYRFWDGKDFLYAIDSQSMLKAVNSDMLHALYFLQPGDLEKHHIKRIEQYAESLKTPFGFRTYAPNQPDYNYKKYHLGSIWPFEQYLIMKGAYKHRLWNISSTALSSLRKIENLGAYPEILYYKKDSAQMGGSTEQLWTYSAVKAMLGERKVLDHLQISIENAIKKIIR